MTRSLVVYPQRYDSSASRWATQRAHPAQSGLPANNSTVCWIAVAGPLAWRASRVAKAVCPAWGQLAAYSCRSVQTWDCLASRPVPTALRGGRLASVLTQAVIRLRGPRTSSCALWATIVVEAQPASSPMGAIRTACQWCSRWHRRGLDTMVPVMVFHRRRLDHRRAPGLLDTEKHNRRSGARQQETLRVCSPTHLRSRRKACLRCSSSG